MGEPVVENVAAAERVRGESPLGRWLLLAALFLLLLPALFAARAAAQGLEHPDDVARQIKAAYLYKFASYVEWPRGVFARDDSPVVIGVIGDDPLAADLARMVVGKTVNGRRLAVRELQRDDPLAGVHVLFVGRTRGKPLAAILAAARGQPLLVVSDSHEAHVLGSAINFVMVDQRLRFEVALKPATDNGLKLSALMLTAAYRVTQAGS
jgi:hypothetical protein